MSVNAQVVEIPEDVDLLARCRAGEARAWRALYDAHFDFVQRVARRLGIPEGERDDVVQEVFLVAFRRLEGFSGGRFSTWLYRIAANVVSGRHRRRRLREALFSLWGRAEEESSARAPDQEYEAKEAEARVGEVLARMAPKKREVFALFELDGLSGEEIAERVGCPVDTVWSRLHYARRDFERLARKRGLAPLGGQG